MSLGYRWRVAGAHRRLVEAGVQGPLHRPQVGVEVASLDLMAGGRCAQRKPSGNPVIAGPLRPAYHVGPARSAEPPGVWHDRSASQRAPMAAAPRLRLHPDRRGAAPAGCARLAGPGARHGGRDLHHAAAADLPCPRRRRPSPSRAHLRPLRGAHAAVVLGLRCPALGKIGERLEVNAASVTNAVDRLEADGLATRRSNPTTAGARSPSSRRPDGGVRRRRRMP